MIEDSFEAVYQKFKMQFYKSVFAHDSDKSGELNAMEVFSVEVIYALNEPTISEFANFTGMSQPNAAYKIANLIKKGYIEKEQMTSDRRVYRLNVTDKFMQEYGIRTEYIRDVIENVESILEPECLEVLDDALRILSDSMSHGEE